MIDSGGRRREATAREMEVLNVKYKTKIHNVGFK